MTGVQGHRRQLPGAVRGRVGRPVAAADAHPGREATRTRSASSSAPWARCWPSAASPSSSAGRCCAWSRCTRSTTSEPRSAWCSPGSLRLPSWCRDGHVRWTRLGRFREDRPREDRRREAPLMAIFDGFSDREVDTIKNTGTHVTLPADWSPIWEKTPADKAYIIVDGRGVRTPRRRGDRQARPRRHLRRGRDRQPQAAQRLDRHPHQGGADPLHARAGQPAARGGPGVRRGARPHGRGAPGPVTGRDQP